MPVLYTITSCPGSCPFSPCLWSSSLGPPNLCTSSSPATAACSPTAWPATSASASPITARPREREGRGGGGGRGGPRGPARGSGRRRVGESGELSGVPVLLKKKIGVVAR